MFILDFIIFIIDFLENEVLFKDILRFFISDFLFLIFYKQIHPTKYYKFENLKFENKCSKIINSIPTIESTNTLCNTTKFRFCN